MQCEWTWLWQHDCHPRLYAADPWEQGRWRELLCRTYRTLRKTMSRWSCCCHSRPLILVLFSPQGYFLPESLPIISATDIDLLFSSRASESLALLCHRFCSFSVRFVLARSRQRNDYKSDAMVFCNIFSKAIVFYLIRNWSSNFPISGIDSTELLSASIAISYFLLAGAVMLNNLILSKNIFFLNLSCIWINYNFDIFRTSMFLSWRCICWL